MDALANCSRCHEVINGTVDPPRNWKVMQSCRLRRAFDVTYGGKSWIWKVSKAVHSICLKIPHLDEALAPSGMEIIPSYSHRIVDAAAKITNYGTSIDAIAYHEHGVLFGLRIE
jgi:hypothetical protein